MSSAQMVLATLTTDILSAVFDGLAAIGTVGAAIAAFVSARAARDTAATAQATADQARRALGLAVRPTLRVSYDSASMPTDVEPWLVPRPLVFTFEATPAMLDCVVEVTLDTRESRTFTLTQIGSASEAAELGVGEVPAVLTRVGEVPASSTRDLQPGPAIYDMSLHIESLIVSGWDRAHVARYRFDVRLQDDERVYGPTQVSFYGGMTHRGRQIDGLAL